MFKQILNSGIEVTSFFMGDVVGDYDNNGFLDLYHPDGGPNNLLRNDGDGTFTDRTNAAGVGRRTLPPPATSTDVNIGWGGMFFDYDNDGDLDLYFVAGLLDSNSANNFQPNGFFENNGDLTFTDKAVESGADDDGIGRAGAFGDFNNDGCVDMYVGNLGTYDSIPGRIGDPATVPGIPLLLQNNCLNTNNWLTIKTTGTTSNADGIGARVKVTTINGEQFREVAAGGSHASQNMLPVHFGLADATLADIEITWPSGIVQTLTNVASNQILEVTEPRTDTIGFARPRSDGVLVFMLRNDLSAGPPDNVIAFGSSTDIPIAGDWDGDGVDSVGFARPRSDGALVFHLRNDLSAGPPDHVFRFGSSTDLPIEGDWDGDGVDSVGFARPRADGTLVFMLRNDLSAGPPDNVIGFGSSTDIPIAGDWDGDGVDSVGFARP